jgi:hypothetical protein
MIVVNAEGVIGEDAFTVKAVKARDPGGQPANTLRPKSQIGP